jgi:hypothetical protein
MTMQLLKFFQVVDNKQGELLLIWYRLSLIAIVNLRQAHVMFRQGLLFVDKMRLHHDSFFHNS